MYRLPPVCPSARPLIGAKPLVPAEASTDAARVVLVDQSLGMAAVSHGATAFDRALNDSL